MPGGRPPGRKRGSGRTVTGRTEMNSHSLVQRASRSRRLDEVGAAPARIGRPRLKPNVGDALRMRDIDMHNCGFMDIACSECGALFFYSESTGSNCCSEYLFQNLSTF